MKKQQSEQQNEHPDFWYESENEDRREHEIWIFDQSDTANLFRDSGDRVIGDFVRRTKWLKEGAYPYETDARYRDDLEAMLCAETGIDYLIYCQMENGVWEDDFSTWEETWASEIRNGLISAMRQYVETAASLAKSIGSSSVDDWMEIVDLAYEFTPYRAEPLIRDSIREATAKRIIELESRAAKRLRMDMMIAKLPRFKLVKSAKKNGKSAKKR